MTWQTVRLGEVCAIDKAQGIYKGLPYVGLEDIESNTARFIGSTEPQAVKSSTFRFSPEHVLYGRLRPYLNKALAPDFEGHCSTEIFPIKPASTLSRQYLLHWLMADATVDRINSTSTGSRMPRADMNDVFDFDFPHPPLAEQQRIVGILDEAFAGIATAKAQAERNRRNAREVFESHLQSVFTQRGDGWSEETLEQVVAKDCSLSYGIVQPGNDKPDGLPIVRPTDLTTKVIRLDELKRIDPDTAKGYGRTILEGGDLLLCVRGSTGAVSIAAPELVGANVTRGIVPIRFNSDLVTQGFGYYAMLSGPVQEQIREKTYGAALMQINIRDLRNVAVTFPSLAKQETIVSGLDSLSEETQHLETLYTRKLAALDELKKSLLQRAFAGEL